MKNRDFPLLAVAALGVAAFAGSASAQLATSGNLSTRAAPAANQAVGSAVAKGGQAVVVGAGAHGGGPAPIVSGAVPQTEPFTSGVTDAGAKVGKGMKQTGRNIERKGVTVSPAGAAKGVSQAPGGLQTQVERAGGIVQ